MNCFLVKSSLGRKLVMAVSGCFLVLFLLFHMAMNLAALFSAEAYNKICEFLGANWYALVGTVVLAGGVVVHFAYALLLTWQNRKARGNVRYAVTVKEEGVDWASKNMLVIGFIVLCGLALHLVHFWSEMQLVEIMGGHENSLGLAPTNGAALIAFTFSKWYNALVYIVWLAAIWFHLTHGVWSMFQTAGWANDKWYPRLKCLSNLVSTLICGGFALVVVFFFLKENGWLCCACC
ncbi:MAG: succinate dehydrogenase/fumarate reductase cytochrome b subunit [Rikenellaceae bacterium]|nr:succinate dehydrogenase/fumarate reductase cytochrome b subunit [Rikenellaceae bacterium]